jgi:SAM-dependent methyltransferase
MLEQDLVESPPRIGPMSRARGALRKFVFSEPVFHLSRSLAYWGSRRHLRAALDLKSGERLLDVGCGTGVGAPLTEPSFYAGVDSQLPTLRFARRRFPHPSTHFVCAHAGRLPFAPGSFDKGVAINVIHHLDDDAVDRLLLDLQSAVSGPVIVLDMDPARANPLERLLMAHDRGEYIRDLGALRTLLARRYHVDAEQRFHNAAHTVPQVLFRLRQRA